MPTSPRPFFAAVTAVLVTVAVTITLWRVEALPTVRTARVLAQRDLLWIADLGNHRIVTVPLPAFPSPPPSR